MNIYVILNGAQRSEESRWLKKERFFAALRMTNNSRLIALWDHTGLDTARLRFGTMSR
jgi:hypothetical protein